MKTTGYRLQTALREATQERDLALTQWTGSLKAFPNEEKASPHALMERISHHELRIARLQAAQQSYNLQVFCPLLPGDSERHSLSVAVKLVGSIGRTSKLWSAALPKVDRYAYSEEVRSEGEVRATSTLSVEAAETAIRTTSKYLSALREAIQVANATPVDITGIEDLGVE